MLSLSPRRLVKRSPAAFTPYNAFGVGQGLLDLLGHFHFSRMALEPAVEDLVVAPGFQEFGIFLEDAAEVAHRALAVCYCIPTFDIRSFWVGGRLSFGHDGTSGRKEMPGALGTL